MDNSSSSSEQSEEKLSVLIVDDEEGLRSSLRLNLQLAGYKVSEAARAEPAFSLLEKEEVDIVLCDLRMPGVNGMHFIEKCHQMSPDTAIVLMTGYGSHELALEAMRRGAYDYISKPFDAQELILTLKKIEEREQLRSENEELRSEVEQRYNFSNIVAKSKSMKDVFETVKRLANFHTTVLITGESGTGKELLARAIHHNSPRRSKPFVAINCGAIPEALMESELFGHKKGAFTDASRDKKGLFEEASGGTLFLDEIGEMPGHLQVKLLRALQERQIRPVGDEKTIPVDVRVIAATLRNLEEDVANKRFRDDLYYRLNVVSIHLPALSDRPEDIPVLVEHFMEKHNHRHGLSISCISKDAMRALMSYEWRGNIRELENAIERALVLTDGPEITLDSLPDVILRQVAGRDGMKVHEGIRILSDDNLSIKQHSKTLEVQLIQKALDRTKGNRTHAAKLLEISHRALLYKLKEYGLGD
ncbi:MAG: sigma-54-dependent Fis family transcriptional regulator [Bdellovibrionales bacterium]|nr:sigma-54-dependent Fis family transcriptional regulator [Bdellovibrionales bacterium]